jgi:hypothetical protein
MELLQERLVALERENRFWRRVVGVLVVVGLLLFSSRPGVTQTTLEQRVAALESKTAHLARIGNELYITGANLHLRNGLKATNGLPVDPGSTDPTTTRTNGLGNLIVGYSERRNDGGDLRTGSHNLIIGPYHNFRSYGGLVVGSRNHSLAAYATVSGGQNNWAHGVFSSVSGGQHNHASGICSSVSGGVGNLATGEYAAVSGGATNTAQGSYSVVSGGEQNAATGWVASVSGGYYNYAQGSTASVSGGYNNHAFGYTTAVSGGNGIRQVSAYGWSAGSSGSSTYSGRFRSP